MIRGEVDNAELEEKLREVSSQDPVTGLYNRSHFLDLMDAAVQQAVTARKPSTLAYIHLNGYPSLQADHGLSGIDLLLGQLAGLMREQFGEEADLARFGDSIFAALFKGKTPEQAQAALQRLLKKVENHLFELNGRSAQATLSIGVAGLDEKTAKAQDVMNRAHRCADDAARKGGSQIKQYNPAEELAAAAQRSDVIAILQQALETNSFRLLFQPVISLRGDSHENYEVLLRLLNPQGQEVPPAEFLHAAKEAGLAEKIDRWVILNSIKLLAEHRAKGHQTKLFVHLSSASLQDPGLLPWLGVALKAARLPPESLVFQISEADATSYLKQAKQLTQGLATPALPGGDQPVRLLAEPVQRAEAPDRAIHQDRWLLRPGPQPGGKPGDPQGPDRRTARTAEAQHRPLRRERQRPRHPVASRRHLHPGVLPAGAEPGDGLRLLLGRRMKNRRPGRPLLSALPIWFVAAGPARGARRPQARPSRSR